MIFRILSPVSTLSAVAVAAALALGLAVAPSMRSEAGPAAAAEAKKVAEFTLDNGLRVVVVPDHRVPVATHMVWYAVGSVEEQPGEYGVAHYLEHMMFKGTPKYPKGEFDRFVARRGGQQNARTWSTGTMYWQRIPKSALAQLMDMEADRMSNLKIVDADVASERAVVMEELRRRQQAVGHDISNLMRAALYADHPEGRAVIGSEESIASLDGAKAQSFYERFYCPSRATLVMAGDVTVAEARKLIEATYAKVPRRAGLAPRVVGKLPEAGVSKRVEAAHERQTNVAVSRTYLTPGVSQTGIGHQYAANMFAIIAGNGMTSRIFRRLVAEQALATNASCGYVLGGALSTFECSAAGKVGVPQQVLEEAIAKVIDELATGSVSEEEFEEVRSRFIASEAARKDNVFNRADTIGSNVSEGVPVSVADNQNEVVTPITRADVERAGREILGKSRNVTSVLVPKVADAAPAAPAPATAN